MDALTISSRRLRRFIATESGGSALLLSAAVVALALANSPWSTGYLEFWSRRSVHVGVNEGLMSLFFFVVGLEIKREFRGGELADRRVAALPVCAALGGMFVPAALYLVVAGDSAFRDGWGVSVATDIAFALGVLGLFRARIPSSLKLFVLAFAIVDDIGGILVIAAFYGKSPDAAMLATAAAGMALYGLAQRRLPDAWWLAAVLAASVWWATFESGVHPTLAAVAVAFLTTRTGRVEALMHPVVSFAVLPLFALANAGISLDATTLSGDDTPRLVGAVVAGLVLGKAIGIFGGAWLGVRSGVATLPVDVGWTLIAAAALLGGIGFTVSLFVADLAFEDPALLNGARLGIAVASVTAAALASTWLLLVTRRDTS